MRRLLGPNKRRPIWILAAFSGLISLAAHAETEPIRIEYRAVAGCPSVEEFRALVFVRTASARPASDNELARTFVVTIEAARDGVVGSLVVREPSGATLARKVEGARCEQVATALSLATALAIDPQAPMATQSSAKEGKGEGDGVNGQQPANANVNAKNAASSAPDKQTKPSTPEPEPDESSESEPDEPDKLSSAQHRKWWTVALGPSLESGISPKLSLGASAQFEWHHRAASTPLTALGVEFTWLGSATYDVSTASSSFQFLLARPFVCSFELPVLSKLRAGPCLGAELGAVTGTGADLPNAATETRFWAAAELLLRLRVEPSESWFIGLDGALVLPLTRYTFVFREPDTQIYEVPSLATAANLRLGFKL